MEQRETADYGGDVNQFLTFSLGTEEYGMDILRVQEIKGNSAITHIPNAPKHVKGVMNLRGTVVPVVDLRAKFSMEAVEYGKFSVIIVVMVGQKVSGLVVDAVSDVLNIAASDIRPAPDFGASCDTRFISGVASIGEKLAVLLEIDKLLSEEEVAVTAGSN
ncbi:MAG TPA: chemotaxis protein CheW [Bryobacteraceae bacterium]|nr:chemotaxis protein CheW [Bryobacteraceae bacterium]